MTTMMMTTCDDGVDCDDDEGGSAFSGRLSQRVPEAASQSL